MLGMLAGVIVKSVDEIDTVKAPVATSLGLLLVTVMVCAAGDVV
jgi:hypothetical protein